jgi:uncharacterized membrane protein YoaK (UPF0700 family)
LRRIKLLPAVLAVIAGATDAIGFLGLGGLLAAHITGNLVILAAYVVMQGHVRLAPMLAVPVFIIVAVLTRLLAAAVEASDMSSLRPLLILQALLLCGFCALRFAAGPGADVDAAIAVLAGMLAVAAMAVQNAMVQICLKGTPSTAVMTTNITRFSVGIGEMIVGRDASRGQGARVDVTHTGVSIFGFVIGCAIGAAAEAMFGIWSTAMPAGLAIIAVALGRDQTRALASGQSDK